MMFILILLVLIVIYIYNKKSKESFIANSITQPPFESWTNLDCTLEQNCSIDNNTPDNVKFLIDNFTKCREKAFIDPCESPNFKRLNAAFCFPEFNNDPCKDTQYLNSPQGKEFCCRTKHHFEYDIQYDDKGNQRDAKRTDFFLTFDYSKNFMKNNYDKCVSLGYTPCKKETDNYAYVVKQFPYPKLPELKIPDVLKTPFKTINPLVCTADKNVLQSSLQNTIALYTPKWVTSNWGGCNVQIQGKRVRTVECKNSYGTISPDGSGNCTLPKPDTSIECGDFGDSCGSNSNCNYGYVCKNNVCATVLSTVTEDGTIYGGTKG